MTLPNSNRSWLRSVPLLRRERDRFRRRDGPRNISVLWDQSKSCRFLKILFKPAAIFFPQGEVNVLPQIGFERGLWEFQFVSRIQSDGGDLRDAELARSLKIREHVRSDNFRPGSPEGHNSGQARQLAPFPDDIIHMKNLRSDNSERRRLAYGASVRCNHALFLDGDGNA